MPGGVGGAAPQGVPPIPISMKRLLNCVLFLLWQAAAHGGDAYPSTGAVEHDDQAATWLYEGKAYDSLMPTKTLEASPDFDIENPSIAMPLKQITMVAYAGLNEFTKSTNGFGISSITLRRSERQPKKWYYLVSFDGRRGRVGITITIDGHAGVIRESRHKIGC